MTLRAREACKGTSETVFLSSRATVHLQRVGSCLTVELSLALWVLTILFRLRPKALHDELP